MFTSNSYLQYSLLRYFLIVIYFLKIHFIHNFNPPLLSTALNLSILHYHNAAIITGCSLKYFQMFTLLQLQDFFLVNILLMARYLHYPTHNYLNLILNLHNTPLILLHLINIVAISLFPLLRHIINIVAHSLFLHLITLQNFQKNLQINFLLQ